MFAGADAFNQPLNDWDVGSVTNMDSMFQNADIFNQPLGDWNVENVTNMEDVFVSAAAFSQDISKWCVTAITSKPYNTGSSWFWDDGAAFENVASLQPDWGACPSQADLYMYTDGDLEIDYEEVITITASFTLTWHLPADYRFWHSNRRCHHDQEVPTLWTYVLNTPSSLSSGTYAVTVKATDTVETRPVSSNVSLTLTTETTPPTVSHALSQIDPYLNATDVVTYTATFSEPMTATPTVDINGQGYETLSPVAGSNDEVWTYYIDMSTYTGPQGA